MTRSYAVFELRTLQTELLVKFQVLVNGLWIYKLLRHVTFRVVDKLFVCFVVCRRINLTMSPATAAKIVALRPALESLIVKALANPDELTEPQAVDSDVMNVVRALSRPNVAKFGAKLEEGEEYVKPHFYFILDSM